MGVVIVAALAASLATAALADAAPHEINITSDSAPGWLPTKDQEDSARATVDRFLAALDQGHVADAYALMAEANRSAQPFASFADRQAKFNARAGTVKERRIVKITWTKDPADAPAAGVYAAVDLVSRFAEVDRHCGVLILYQAPDGGAFKAMRQEDNFISNADALAIERQQSRAQVDVQWTELSARCPTYPESELHALAAPVPETARSTIGYPSVAAALSALKARRDVAFSMQGEWTIATDPTDRTLWSFPPKGHPAYPSAVKRRIENRDGGAYMQMSVQCEASKAACDDLVRSFQQLNAQMAASLKGR